MRLAGRSAEMARLSTADRELYQRVRDCSLPADRLDHTAHVRLAWVYLCKAPLDCVLFEFRDDLRRYATHHGAPEKYHETITWTYLFLIRQRMEELAQDHDWQAFHDANPDLFVPHGELLDRYYRSATLDSAVARRLFVLPDVRSETSTSTEPAA